MRIEITLEGLKATLEFNRQAIHFRVQRNLSATKDNIIQPDDIEEDDGGVGGV